MPEATENRARTSPVDFVIIGAMKSGTSTLFAWLDASDEVTMCTWKEPSFFSVDERWERGLEWYDGLFPANAEGLRGEASTSYTDPRFAAAAAERLGQMAPDARLIYLLRNPVERTRSHYRHQVQRNREQRPLGEALADGSALYLAQSQYWSCLQPYLDHFSSDQILVVTLEDLIDPTGSAWSRVQEHLGLQPGAAPEIIRNVTGDKQQFTPAMRWLWERNLLPSRDWVPQPLRTVGKRLLMKQDDAYQSLIEGSRDPIDSRLLIPVWEDVARLEEWLDRSEPLWERA